MTESSVAAAAISALTLTNGALVYMLKRKANGVKQPVSNDERCRVNGERIAKLEADRDHAAAAIDELKNDMKDSFTAVFNRIDGLRSDIQNSGRREG